MVGYPWTFTLTPTTINEITVTDGTNTITLNRESVGKTDTGFGTNSFVESQYVTISAAGYENLQNVAVGTSSVTMVAISSKNISQLSDGTNTYTIKDATAREGLSSKQDTLVSGTNIKTINNESILGSGNISISTTVDQTYDLTSANAQSGVAINGAGFLKNTATGTNSISILGTPITYYQGVNIGYNSTGGYYTVSIGYDAQSSAAGGIAIGYSSRSVSNSTAIGTQAVATGSSGSIALGRTAEATGSSSIQIGRGTNSENNSFYVGLSSSNNYKLLGSDGTIPNARLNVMTGADGTNAGTKGAVPAPTATDNTKFLRGDGTWAVVEFNENSFFPTSWGDISYINQTLTPNNESGHVYDYAWSIRFSNGYTLPVIVNRYTMLPNWNLEAIELTEVTNYNSAAIYNSTLYNAYAYDNPSQMMWTREGGQIAYKDYVIAKNNNWDEGHLVDNHASVTTSRFTFTITGNTFEALDTYTNKTYKLLEDGTLQPVANYLSNYFANLYTTQNIGGLKTFTNNLSVKLNNPILGLKNDYITKGTKPGSTRTTAIKFLDGAGGTNNSTNGLCEISHNVNSSNVSYLNLTVYPNTANTISDECGIVINNASSSVRNVYPSSNNVIGLGSSSRLWKQLFAGTTTISTSDERLKQQITEIPEEVLKAWSEINFYQYKFNDSVKEKGNKARFHTGVIAQRIKATFEKYNLNAFDYGLLCYDEWNAEEPVYDEDGNISIPGQEAGNRYSIRYEECLCIEAAYQRYRADKLEERLNILEDRLGL